MKSHTAILAALALSTTLAIAQNGPPPPGPQDRYDDRSWQAPQGYNDIYHENGTANMVARQGYSAGYTQGQSDFNGHHSFRPHNVDTYKHVPDSPQGINRDDFKRQYREAFDRGYAKGYGR